VTAPIIAVRANLNNDDDEGFELEPPAQRQRSVGLSSGPLSWVHTRRVDEDGQVHFEQLTAEEATKFVPRAS
jgi:hypothetical protein